MAIFPTAYLVIVLVSSSKFSPKVHQHNKRLPTAITRLMTRSARFRFVMRARSATMHLRINYPAWLVDQNALAVAVLTVAALVRMVISYLTLGVTTAPQDALPVQTN